MTLIERARRLYDTGTDEDLYRLALDNWPAADEAIPDGIAEACRYAFIRAQQRRLPEAHLFRARAMAAAIIENSRVTIAGLLFQPLMIVLEDAADPELRDDAVDRARKIISEIPRLVPPDDPDWNVFFARLFLDKSALIDLLSGRYADAASNYEAALTHTSHDRRGALKVEAGLLLARWLDELAAGTSAPSSSYADRTDEIRQAAEAEGFSDVAAWATRNLEAMRTGDNEGWVPYEVL